MRLNLFLLIIILNCSCNKQKKLYDKIHLSTDTDSSYIQLFVSSDSIIILQLERGECDGYGSCKYGPKYYAQVSKQNQIFRLINEEAQRIMSDTFQLERIFITHASTSSLKFLFKDNLINNFQYYGSESNCRDLVEIEKKLLNIIGQANRVNLLTTDKLLDISDMANIDSIRIDKLKPIEIDGYNGKYINYINDYEIGKIRRKGHIDTFINIIKNQKILDTIQRKKYGEFIPKYKLSFFRNRLICFHLETDLRIMPYSWLQVLKFDSVLIKNFN